ncbi:MAG: NAD(P)/FAD-dependent oxidoreductase [Bacteroidota bacterium]
MIDVAIIGAGLSGLACARTLAARGIDCAVFEASDAVGGRVRTERVDGFQIDRGFQVFLTAYPEAAAVLDYDALDFQAFDPGAKVWLGDGFQTVGDPFRKPLQALPTLLADVGSVVDKLKILRLRQAVTAGDAEAVWARPEVSTEAALRERYGFSDKIVERFFRPFLGGIFLDRSLSDSSRAFEFYFRMFSTGDAAVPASGMQAIPEQMAAALPEGTVRLGARVAGLAPGEVQVADGEAVACRAVVVAVEAPEVPFLVPDVDPPPSKSTLQLAWAADTPPTEAAVLMLDGVGTGPVNNAQVMSAVAPSYAPAGQALVTASVVGHPVQADEVVEAEARAQLRGWFGEAVDGWRLLRAYRVLHALPDLATLDPPEQPPRLRDGLYLTGDWRRNGSINGAMRAGRHAAEAVAADLGVVSEAA